MFFIKTLYSAPSAPLRWNIRNLIHHKQICLRDEPYSLKDERLQTEENDDEKL
jgi:hypothetical protein